MHKWKPHIKSNTRKERKMSSKSAINSEKIASQILDVTKLLGNLASEILNPAPAPAPTSTPASAPASAPGKFTCHPCNKTFTRAYTLKRHEETKQHTEKSPLSAPAPVPAPTTTTKLKSSMSSPPRPKKRESSEECDDNDVIEAKKKAKKNQSLPATVVFKKEDESVLIVSRFKCKSCHKLFASLENLEKHASKHSQSPPVVTLPLVPVVSPLPEKEKEKEKYMCECGKELCKSSKHRHDKSLDHLSKINSL